MWDEITNLFPNLNGCTIEVWERKSNFISHFYECNYLSMLGSMLNHVSRKGHSVIMKSRQRSAFHLLALCEEDPPARDRIPHKGLKAGALIVILLWRRCNAIYASNTEGVYLYMARNGQSRKLLQIIYGTQNYIVENFKEVKKANWKFKIPTAYSSQ